MKKFTKQQADECVKKIIASNRRFQRTFRLLLIDAYDGKAYEVLGFKTFTDFLDSIEGKTSNLDTTYMRRHFHAGKIEVALFGREHVGEMCEGALRVLSENVAPPNHRKVYDLACKSMKTKKQHPSDTQLIEAAKKLNVYGQQEAKIKCKVDKSSTEKEIAGNKSKKESLLPSKATASNAVKIKTDKFSLRKLGRELTTKLSHDNAEKLADMLEGVTIKPVNKEFKYIIKNYNEDDLLDIAIEIDNALEPKKSKKVQAK